MEKLTDKAYWDGTYSRRKKESTRAFDGFLNYSNRMVLGKLLPTELGNKQVLEVGAGDSLWLPYLAKRFPSSRFAGVDYSERGCALLSQRAKDEGVDVDVMHEDIFVEQSRLHGMFDIVISLGVVEHFDVLESVLVAKSRYLKPGGILFTVIPNMAGLLGTLTRRWNRAVYEKHNPHDWPSFLRGHQQAGMEVTEGGYLGSIDFGILSSCFPDRKGPAWQLNRALVAVSVAGWWVESKVGGLPGSRMLSPYIYAVCRKSEIT